MARNLALAAALAALAAAPAVALADSDMATMMHEGVGLPMKPADAAAGPWTLITRGKPVCTVRFSAERGPDGVYPADFEPECAAELPPGVIGWKPVTDGLGLVRSDGVVVLDFNQWTSRDLVARRAGAPFLELKRPKS